MQQDATLFYILLFFAVVFISQALILPAAGSKAKHKQLSQRLKESQAKLDEEARSLLQEHYMKSLTPMDRRLVKVPLFSSLKKTIELSGYDWSLGQTLAVTLILSVCASLIVLLLGQPFYI
ncbi:pilus assembly protein TadB, partial [Vibrio sinaloensis]